MAKSADAFRTISEVAEWMDTPAHVLRFWESKFTQIKPVKRAGGRRYYRPADMRLLGGIKKLLHEDGMTIKGAQKILREQGIKHVASLCALSVGEEDDVEDLVVEEVQPEEPVDTVIPFAKPVEEPAEPVAEEPAEPAMSDHAPVEAADEHMISATISEDAIDEVLDAPDDDVEVVVERDEPDPAPAEPTVAMAQEDGVDEGVEPVPLPGFLQRAMEDAAPEQDTGDTPLSSEPANDDAAEAEPTEPNPSVLTQLAKIKALSPESAANMAPYVECLRALCG